MEKSSIAAESWYCLDFASVGADQTVAEILHYFTVAVPRFLVVHNRAGEFTAILPGQSFQDMFAHIRAARFPGDLDPHYLAVETIMGQLTPSEFHQVNLRVAAPSARQFAELPERNVLIVDGRSVRGVVPRENFRSWIESLKVRYRMPANVLRFKDF